MRRLQQELIRIVKGPTGGLLMSLGLAALLGGVAMAAPGGAFAPGAEHREATPAPSQTAAVAGASRGAVVPSAIRANDHASAHAGLGSGNGRDTNAHAHGGQAHADARNANAPGVKGQTPSGASDHRDDHPAPTVPGQGPSADHASTPDAAGAPASPSGSDGHATTSDRPDASGGRS
jgi:hypothetical protein